ncbi:MAG: excinuclease ABC subunit UvrC [candidate division WOR-3 bacterium]|jgi:excinuclease ABC subunit C|nr:excinuclease ABC subunit UvrC [candidate division WOR-3 bacterium]MCR4423895.1 excinuclease ABC subunit UvrC [candidate division WOR-3 bacterium]MDH7519233.1 excinuclease ABC subunit UvrC [bacterium]
MKDRVAEKIAQAPTEPGVYLLKDDKGRVIYIGKARILRDRLRAYLGGQKDPRLAALVRRTSDIETIVTRSEVEALLLEESLIKIKKPRYNVRLRDDKKYPYLKITVNEPFPRIFVTRNIKPDGAVLFGPYTSARELRRALRAVKRIFRIRTCKRTLPDPSRAEPCLNFQMKRCLGPCRGNVDADEYRQRVNDVIQFLSGNSEKLTGELERRMWEEAQAQRYEQAALLRDQLMALREIIRNQQVATTDRIGRDVIGLARAEKSAAATLFRIREGKIVAREEYLLNATRDISEEELLHGLLRSIYTHTADLPEEIVLPAPIAEEELFRELFWEKGRRKVEISAPQRGEKRKLVELAQRNAEKALVEALPATARIPEGSRQLAEILGLPTPPRLIEGVDISNTQGSNAVGSVVVFRDGKPIKSQYRLFKIRTVSGPNDFAMMEEVLARRVRGLLEKNLPLPDLVLVDGGKGQLSAAVKAYHQFDQEIPILGLAKRTDSLFYIDGREISIPATSAALKLLKRIRDESHRFAITFHRKLRSKKLVESEIDKIPGIGTVRRQALLQHFGSLNKLRGAGVDDIARVKGIGRSLAEKIYEYLHPSDSATLFK